MEMLRRAVSIIVAATLLAVTLTTFNAQIIKADGYVVINPDGSVEGTEAGRIRRDGDIYTFTDNINGSIGVMKDNVVIDGAHYALEGIERQSAGISMIMQNNVTIKNVKITGFDRGIELMNCSFCSMSGNIITRNYVTGILFTVKSGQQTYGNNITGNIMEANGQYGIYFERPSVDRGWAKNNIICGNNISLSHYGIWIEGGSENTQIFGNRITNNLDWGIHLESYCDGNSIFENYIADSPTKIDIFDSSNNSIFENNIVGKGQLDSGSSGIVLRVALSNNNKIYQNNLTGSSRGIILGGVKNNTITGNNITACNDCGISFSDATGNVISENNIVNNNFGICLNTVLGGECRNNEFYHNNFMNNTVGHVLIYNREFGNSWDDGYPCGGNYWGNYAGSDNFWGEKQDVPGNDMIGDAPYTISTDAIDRYPLIKPWPDFQISVLNEFHIVAISNCSLTDCCFDQRLYEISFNISASVPDSCKMIVSKWMLDGAFNLLIDNAPATWSIAWSHEYHMINFTIRQGIHNVKIVGESALRFDLNQDGVINIVDIALLARQFGRKLP
jgi:parallel beta-helix repeat protein